MSNDTNRSEADASEKAGIDGASRLFLVLEGGGAKALAHVGTLKALEEENFQLVGLAGTSAGAIVAALRSAGYKADEIVNPLTGTTILDLYAEITGQKVTPIGLIGKWQWMFVQLLRYFSDSDALKVLLYKSITVTTAMMVVVTILFGFIVALACIGIISILLTLVFLAVFQFFWRRGGIASARDFRDVLGKLLSQKVFGAGSERPLTMGDLNTADRPYLRIVAADISTRQLKLFSSTSEQDKDILVADAVCASMCIPFIFRPWRIGDRYHVDGGIVSNLPAWPFDEERELDSDAVTVASEIVDRTPLNPNRGLSQWFSDLAHTALFGSSILNKRAVPRLEVISLDPGLDLLDFDISPKRISQAVLDSTNAARAHIIRELIDRPKLYQTACQRLQATVRPLLTSIPGALRKPDKIGRTRVSVAFAESEFPNSLRLVFSSGFETDLDEGIRLPKEGTLIGAAWTTGEYYLMTAPFDSLSSPGLRRLNKTFARDIEWIFTFPIYVIDTNPAFVVAIDGSDLISEDEEVFDRIMGVLASETERHFNPLAEKLEGN